MSSPDSASRFLGTERSNLGAVPLPPDFSFPGMTPEIPLDPASRRFEPAADFVRWGFYTGLAWLTLPWFFRAPFPRHDAERTFVYPLTRTSLADDTAPGPLEIALFSDFGTGLDYARYIARHIAHHAPDVVVHLGDVYFTGSAREYDEHFARIVEPLLEISQVFAMNGNHEMLSRGSSYFRYLSQKRARSGGVRQLQEGSYFCLASEHVQLIAIDSDYHAAFGGRYRDRALVAWLTERLSAGRAAGKLNVLLSQHYPFKIGTRKLTKLYADLRSHLDQVDLWFWGDDHGCALFDRSDELPFVGCCIGHAGHPYKRQTRAHLEKTLAPHHWFEDEPRYPDWTNERQEMGNPGFVRLFLPPGQRSVEFAFVDWMRSERARFSFDGVKVVELSRAKKGERISRA